VKTPEIDNVLGMRAKIRTFGLSVALYGYETWSFTLQDGHGQRALQRSVLWKIFGPERNELTGNWRRLHNEELHDLTGWSDIKMRDGWGMRHERGGEIFTECWEEKLKDGDNCCKSEGRFNDNIKIYFFQHIAGSKAARSWPW